MSELPKGWVLTTLDEIALLVRNGVFASRPKETPPGSPILRISAVRPMRLDADDVRFAHPTPSRADEFKLRGGDLLFTRYSGTRDFVGACAVVPEGAAGLLHPDKLIRVVLHADAAAPGFVAAYASSPDGRRWLESVMRTTAGQTGLAGGDLRRFPVRLAPLIEQERIVTAIDEAFSKLDAGQAGLRTARQLLKRMREAVLAAAVTGRLVPQDPTDTPATKLLAGSGLELDADAELSELPDGWCWSTLGGVSRSDGYGSSVKCGYDAVGVGVLRIPNIQDGRVDLVDLKRAPEGSIPDALMLAPGDLLIVRTNGSRDLIGRSAPVTQDTGCSFASYLIRFRLNSAVVDGEYVSLMLSSSAWRRRLEASAASSAGQYNLSLRTLEPMPVAVPPLAEQLEIVAEVDRQMSFLQACDRAVDSGLARSAALRRSVLKAAFEGLLVPQDSSDEPASALLERIHAERATNDGSSGGRRRNKVEAS